MSIVVRKYSIYDLEEMTKIWNLVVMEGKYFPQENSLSIKEAAAFFAEQTYTGVAEVDGVIVGLYPAFPNCVTIITRKTAITIDI